MKKIKIYVASSWRNEQQPEVVKALNEIKGVEVYDFRHPVPGDNGFHWSEIDEDWKNWTPEQLRKNLEHDVAIDGFNKDMSALGNCDICVLVMPCGRSAHLELGYAVGANKYTVIQLADGEPELMIKMVDYITINTVETVKKVQALTNALLARGY